MILVVAAKCLLYISLLLFGVWCTVFWKTRRIRHTASQLHSSKYKPLPFIGHLHHIINKEWDGATALIMDGVRDVVEKRIQTACIWLGPFPLITVWGADDVQKVLTTSAANEKSDLYDNFKFAIGNGLLTAPNSIWRTTRAHANPMVHPRNLEQLVPSINQNCQELVKNLSSHLDGAAFNVYDYIMKSALKGLYHMIYGTEFPVDMNSQVFKRLLHIIERVADIMHQRMAKPWLWFMPIFKYLNRQDLDELDVLKININDQIKELEAESRRTHPNGKKIEDVTEESSTNGVLTLLESYRSMQNKSQGKFTDKDLAEEIITLCGTGGDTIGVTVASCLVALAQYPDIQDKLYEEISLVVDQDEITLEDIRKMQYLDQVYNETLRVTSIVPFIARKCTEDLKLSECTVPAGNSVLVMLAGLHLDPTVYAKPHTFDPEHFSPKNCMNIGKNNFMPFSGGPRDCLGKPYAQIVVKLMVVHILRHYKVFTNMDIHKIRRRWAVILMGSESYSLKIQKRHGH